MAGSGLVKAGSGLPDADSGLSEAGSGLQEAGSGLPEAGIGLRGGRRDGRTDVQIPPVLYRISFSFGAEAQKPIVRCPLLP